MGSINNPFNGVCAITKMGLRVFFYIYASSLGRGNLIKTHHSREKWSVLLPFCASLWPKTYAVQISKRNLAPACFLKHERHHNRWAWLKVYRSYTNSSEERFLESGKARMINRLWSINEQCSGSDLKITDGRGNTSHFVELWWIDRIICWFFGKREVPAALACPFLLRRHTGFAPWRRRNSRALWKVRLCRNEGFSRRIVNLRGLKPIKIITWKLRSNS